MNNIMKEHDGTCEICRSGMELTPDGLHCYYCELEQMQYQIERLKEKTKRQAEKIQRLRDIINNL
jgi:hypothetical protein